MNQITSSMSSPFFMMVLNLTINVTRRSTDQELIKAVAEPAKAHPCRLPEVLTMHGVPRNAHAVAQDILFKYMSRLHHLCHDFGDQRI